MKSCRKRCYQGYIEKHWKYSHEFSQAAFDHFARVARKRFACFLPPDRDARIIDVGCGVSNIAIFRPAPSDGGSTSGLWGVSGVTRAYEGLLWN